MYSPYRRSSGTPALRPIQYATLSPMIAPDAAAKMRLAKDACAWLPAITAAVTKTPSLGKGRPMLSSIAAPNTAQTPYVKKRWAGESSIIFSQKNDYPSRKWDSRAAEKSEKTSNLDAAGNGKSGSMARGKPLGHASVQQFAGTQSPGLRRLHKGSPARRRVTEAGHVEPHGPARVYRLSATGSRSRGACEQRRL